MREIMEWVSNLGEWEIKVNLQKLGMSCDHEKQYVYIFGV